MGKDIMNKPAAHRWWSSVGTSVAVVLLLTTAVLIRTQRANAYTYLANCTWSQNVFTYRDVGPVATPALDAGASSWNAPTNVKFYRSNDNNNDINVYTTNFGNSGWVGYTVGACSPTQRWVHYNTFVYPDSPPVPSPQAVVAHEFGHSAGLDHPGNYVALCWNGQLYATAVMHDAIAGPLSATPCSIAFPGSDDIQGMNSKYP